jgi:hypothetical protein
MRAKLYSHLWCCDDCLPCFFSELALRDALLHSHCHVTPLTLLLLPVADARRAMRA